MEKENQRSTFIQYGWLVCRLFKSFEIKLFLVIRGDLKVLLLIWWSFWLGL